MKLRYKLPFFNWLAQLFQKVSGVPPLSMPRAVAGGLKEVTAYGGCALNGIPSEYTEVTYVKNAANTLVKTGVVIGNDDTFKMDIKASVVQGSFYLFQSRDIVATVGTNSSTITGISGSVTGQTIMGGSGVLGSGLVSAITRPLSAVSHVLRIIFTCTNGNASFYVKDLDTGEEDTVSEPYDASQLTRGSTEMCLYGNNGTTVGSAATPNRLARDCRVYYAKLWKNELLVLDLVPVTRNTDNAAGFYNRVNGTFLTASEGSLTAGDTVTQSPDKPCEIWCNNGILRVLDKSSWTIFTNPTSQAGQGVYISPEGRWYALGDRGAGCAIPLTTGKQYTLVIHKKTVDLGTMLRYGQSPQVNPTNTGVRLTDWYRGNITNGQMVSFVAKLPYLVMQLSANAVEAGMIQEAVEVLEAQGGDYTFLEYIEATGTQYIQTTLSGPARWVGAGQGTSISTGSKCILSSLTTSANVYLASRFARAATAQFWTIAGGVQYSQTPTLNYAEYDIDFQANLFTGTINGETVSRRNTLTFTTWTIGNAFGTGGAQYPFIGHIYRQQAYQNQVLAGDFIPAIRNSDNAVGMYDAVSGTFFENAGTDVFTAGPIIGSGEVLKLTPSNDTAGVANLLKIGDYVDTQEILTGLINHQLGILVLKGNEAAGWNVTNTSVFHTQLATLYPVDFASNPNNNIAVCSHFKVTPRSTSLATFINDGEVGWNTNGAITFRNDSITTLTGWTTFLAEQYSAGTPVIVVYPLTAAQGEVAPVPQAMQTAQGDNTLEITQASLAGLELEAEYKRH